MKFIYQQQVFNNFHIPKLTSQFQARKLHIYSSIFTNKSKQI